MATMPNAASPLSQALTRKKNSPLPAILLVVGVLVCLSVAAYGYLESRKTEKVVIFAREVAYGHQISTEDITTIEVPLHRAEQLTGITNVGAVVGMYATRNLGTHDLAQPGMLMPEPPTQPVYPNGEQLTGNMVPVPFSTTTIGPITYHDRVNLGFNDSAGSPDLCDQAKSAAAGDEPTSMVAQSGPTTPRPFACRFLSDVRVLYVDDGKSVAYLEMTPYQAQTVWAIQAAGLQLWGERYGATSDTLPALERLDIGQVNTEELTAPVEEPEVEATNAVPGQGGDIPGSIQP